MLSWLPLARLRGWSPCPRISKKIRLEVPRREEVEGGSVSVLCCVQCCSWAAWCLAARFRVDDVVGSMVMLARGGCRRVFACLLACLARLGLQCSLAFWWSFLDGGGGRWGCSWEVERCKEDRPRGGFLSWGTRPSEAGKGRREGKASILSRIDSGLGVEKGKITRERRGCR